jgi:hypothetical protein
MMMIFALKQPEQTDREAGRQARFINMDKQAPGRLSGGECFFLESALSFGLGGVGEVLVVMGELDV